MKRSQRLPVLALVACLGIPGCSESVAPSPGVLRVMVKIPRPDVGAVLIRVSGGAVDSVESSGYATYAARFGSDSTRVIVAGTLIHGELIRLHVPDVEAAGDYRVFVREAASRTTFALQPTAGYSITIGR